MRRVTDQHQLVAPEIFDDQTGTLRRERHQTEVRVTFQHLIIYLRRAAITADDFHFGIKRAVFLEERREFMQPDTVDRGDA